MKHNIPRVEVPKNPQGPSDDIRRYSALIYGPSGIGKSTFASRAEGALFLATEPGLQGLTRREIPINSWEELLGAYQAIKANPDCCKVVILDTAENAYKMLENRVKREYGVDHLNMGALGFMKGRGVVDDEFFTLIQDFCRLPSQGFWIIAHGTTEEVPSDDGNYIRACPDLPPAIRPVILGYVSLVLACVYEKGIVEKQEAMLRMVYTGGLKTVMAKDRSGRLPQKFQLKYELMKHYWDDFGKPSTNGQEPGAK